MRILLLAALLAPGAPVAAAAVITDWDAASGALPSAVTPPWALSGSAADASVGGGAMTLTGRTSWSQDATTTPGFDLARPFAIEARVRYVSGTHSLDSREGVGVYIATGEGFGNTLFIGDGRIFINSDNVLRGATAAVDTAGFHTYTLDVGAPGADGDATFTVRYDGVATLSGSTFYSLPAHGTDPGISFGGGSYYADATSQWQFVRNATAGAVPEPAAWALMVGGFGLVGTMARRRKSLLSGAY